MKIQLTRDSVAMGDDCYAPHPHTIDLPENATIIEIIDAITSSSYLANISGGKASWSVVSHNPIAVIAQQWSKAKILPQFNHSLDSLLKDADGYKLHINYHAQLDPDIVFSVLRRFHYPN
jgi:hypothetical protein